MMNPKNKTALEIWDDASEYMSSIEEVNSTVPSLMIEFAKLHVEAALKAASEKAKTKLHFDHAWNRMPDTFDVKVDKDSILNAYNINNIK